ARLAACGGIAGPERAVVVAGGYPAAPCCLHVCVERAAPGHVCEAGHERVDQCPTHRHRPGCGCNLAELAPGDGIAWVERAVIVAPYEFGVGSGLNVAVERIVRRHIYE